MINVYVNGKSAGLSETQIKTNMTQKILEVGASNVSKHTADSSILNVLDIAINSLTNPEEFLTWLRNDNRVSKVLVENGCYHIEIPQL